MDRLRKEKKKTKLIILYNQIINIDEIKAKALNHIKYLVFNTYQFIINTTS